MTWRRFGLTLLVVGAVMAASSTALIAIGFYLRGV